MYTPSPAALGILPFHPLHSSQSANYIHAPAFPRLSTTYTNEMTRMTTYPLIVSEFNTCCFRYVTLFIRIKSISILFFNLFYFTHFFYTNAAISGLLVLVKPELLAPHRALLRRAMLH